MPASAGKVKRSMLIPCSHLVQRLWCQSEYTEISELECTSTCDEHISANGLLILTDSTEYTKTNAIQETYPWPTIINLEVYNTHTSLVLIMADLSKLPMVTVSTNHPFQQGSCSAYHCGQLLWKVSDLPDQCPLTHVTTDNCMQMGFL